MHFLKKIFLFTRIFYNDIIFSLVFFNSYRFILFIKSNIKSNLPFQIIINTKQNRQFYQLNFISDELISFFFRNISR